MNLKWIVMGGNQVGKTTFIQAMQFGAIEVSDLGPEEYVETDTVAEVEFNRDQDVINAVEYLSSSPVNPLETRTDCLSKDVIITLISATTPDIENEIRKANLHLDRVMGQYDMKKRANQLPVNHRRPMFFFLLNLELPLLGEREEQDRYVANARRMRDEVVDYAISQGFYSECFTCDVSDKERITTIYDRMKSFVEGKRQGFDQAKSPLDKTSLASRLKALLKSLEDEYKSRIVFNKEDKLVKIQFLRLVMHMYEQSDDAKKTDVGLKSIFDDEINTQTDKERLILEKGLRSRVKAILAEALSDDEKYLNELIRYRDELLEESKPWKPYFNKPLKRKKAAFLGEVIRQFQAGDVDGNHISLHDAYQSVLDEMGSPKVHEEDGSTNDLVSPAASSPMDKKADVLEYTFEEVTKGIHSRVKQLIENIPQEGEVLEHKS